MKISQKILILALSAIAFFAVLLYLGSVDFWNGCKDGAEATEDETLEQLRLQYVGSAELGFAEKACAMSAGERLTLTLLGDAQAMENAAFSSSDPAVATVDRNGVITATGSGVCIISAFSGELRASVAVSVSGDMLAQAAQAVEALANGGDGAYLKAKSVCERLEGCELEGAGERRELLCAILAYASNEGDSKTLENAIEKAQQPRAMCLRAAAACSCKGEMLASDAVISFVGDVTLARFNEEAGGARFPAVYARSGSETYPFDLVKCVFAMDTLSVVNFEGTLTESSAHSDKSFYFRGSPAYAEILRKSGIEAANLENNHSSDYLAKGFVDTAKHLSAEDVSPFYENAPLSLSVPGAQGGGKLVLLAYCWASGSEMDERTKSAIASAIRSHKTSDSCVILNLHWGKERSDTPEQWQIDAAHGFIDAGADLIIGHHPHVLQGMERYNGKYIAYSLGNFAFGGNSSAELPQTLILRAMLGRENGGMTVRAVSVVPCLTTSTGSEKNNYRPVMRFGAQGKKIIDHVTELSKALPYGVDELEWHGI